MTSRRQPGRSPGGPLLPRFPVIPTAASTGSSSTSREDHDHQEKTFLGQTGNFNGEDIVDIIADHPATGRFLARHLYRFFVADEPHVSTWSVTPPIDPDAIEILVDAYNESRGDIRSILRALFNSEFFKNAQFARVKSPAELIVGTVRLAGNYDGFKPGFNNLALECGWQGQELLNPPSVEGWHTAPEWIRPRRFDAPGEFRREDIWRHLTAGRAGNHQAGPWSVCRCKAIARLRRWWQLVLMRWDRWKSVR